MAKNFVKVSLEPPLTLPDLDHRVVKKGLRKVGRAVVRIARKNISRRATVSRPGEFPAMQTGALRKTVKSKVSKSGHSVGVNSFPFDWNSPIPFFVLYGHRAPYTDDESQAHKTRKGHKVAAPREDWVTAAAERYGRTYPSVVEGIIDEAIKPGAVQGWIKQ